MAMTYGSLAKAHSWGKLRIFPALGVKEGVGHNYGVSTMALGSEFTKEKLQNQKTKGGKKHGTYSAAKCGVLAAAEYVVELSKQEPEHGLGQRTPFGVSQSFLQSAVGDKIASPYNNEKMTQFQNKSPSTKKHSPNHS